MRASKSLDQAVIPLAHETLRVTRRRIPTGRVRVKTKVQRRTVAIDESVLSEHAAVQRVKVNKVVDSPPPIRYEGDTIIIPLVSEVLVVQKQLIVREELHIVRRREQKRAPKRY